MNDKAAVELAALQLGRSGAARLLVNFPWSQVREPFSDPMERSNPPACTGCPCWAGCVGLRTRRAGNAITNGKSCGQAIRLIGQPSGRSSIFAESVWLHTLRQLTGCLNAGPINAAWDASGKPT